MLAGPAHAQSGDEARSYLNKATGAFAPNRFAVAAENFEDAPPLPDLRPPSWIPPVPGVPPVWPPSNKLPRFVGHGLGKRERPARSTPPGREVSVRETHDSGSGQLDYAVAGYGAAMVRFARQAMQNRFYDDAVDLGMQALRSGGGYLDARLVLAATHYLLARYPEARRDYVAAPENREYREATRGLATTGEQLDR